jgi:hypothetical protein
VDCDEADALNLEESPSFWADFGIHFMGDQNWRLKQYKKENRGSSVGYFDSVGSKFEEDLKAVRNKVMDDEKTSTWRFRV